MDSIIFFRNIKNPFTFVVCFQKAISKIGESYTLEIGFGSNVEIIQKTKLAGLPLFHGQADVYSFISTVGKYVNNFNKES